MLSALSLAAIAMPTVGKDYAALFSAWKSKHGMSFSSADAESAAFSAFAHNDDLIESHNARSDVSYRLAHNEFSGLTSEQFFSTRLGYNAPERKKTFSMTYRNASLSASLPTEVDWVQNGGVTSVKQQGQCGSCWSFSTAGAIEGAYFVASGTLLNLSEEDLVQCDTTDNGCNGGLMDNAFEWVEQHGIASLADYPYTSATAAGTRGTCDASKSANPAVTITGHADVPAGDEDALRAAVAQQPVSIAIEADKSAFQLYSSGVLDSAACGTSLDHGVLLVGYGTDSSTGKDFWKVKNSWGPTWGEDGYIRMVRGKNQCGLASQASYPTGAKKASGGGGGGGGSYTYSGHASVEEVEAEAATAPSEEKMVEAPTPSK